MKNFKRISALLLVVVLAASLLASCGKKSATFTDILNPEYKAPNEIIESIGEITELAGYSIATQGMSTYLVNDEIALFTKVNTETGFTHYKLFSFRTGTVVKEWATSEKVSYAFSMVMDNYYSMNSNVANGMPFMLVNKAEQVEKEAGVFTTKNTYELYDGAANVLASGDDTATAPTVVSDWVLFDGVLYTVDEETGAVTKKGDMPKNLTIPTGVVMNDTYMYAESSDMITVYDMDFKVVAVWTPSCPISGFESGVLNDGNIMIQYEKKLDPEAKAYDIYYQSGSQVYKYDLVTEIFSVADKTSKEIEFDYVIDSFNSRYDMTQDKTYGAMFTESFENIVTVYPIVDKQVLDSDAQMDIFTMDNNGKLLKSYKITEYQVGIPFKVAENTYYVETLYGYALVDATGTVLNQVSKYFQNVGGTFVDSEGIYNTKFETIYDFEDNEATMIGTSGETIFVKEYVKDDDTGKYKVLAFLNGQKTEITSYDPENKDSKAWVSFSSTYGLYVLKAENSTDYEIYNEQGKQLLKTQQLIDFTFSSWYSDAADTALIAVARDDGMAYYFAK